MPKSAADIFLVRLRQLREGHGLTQEQFSELSGISYKYYQAMEAGRRRDVRLSTVERVAAVYGLQAYHVLSPELPPSKIKRQKRANR